MNTQFEDRQGWASCFPPKNPNSKASFVGVTVLDGRKFWVNVYEKETRTGTRYISVHIQPKEERPQT